MQYANKRRRQLLLGGAVMALAPLARAQSPGSKPVRILVGFPPGQATDTVARLLAEKLQAATGANFIVDNKPGQGGSIALGQLAKAPNDGSVMMIAHMSAMATNPHMYKSVPYDTMKDFDAVGLVGDLPFVLVCNPALPIQSVQDLVQYAKAHPGQLNNASSGNGTVSHLAMEEFKRKAGIQVDHIPYRGSTQGLADVMAGNVSMALETAPAVQPFVQAGKLRALAAGTTRRLGGVLNVPTLEELGYTGINAVTWLMAIYPVGTPKAVIATMFDRINEVVGTPEVTQKLLALGVVPRTSKSPDEAAAYIRSEFTSWGEVVKRSGTTLD